MISCDRVSAGKTTNRQQSAHNCAGAINTFIHVNHGPSSYWGNHNPIDCHRFTKKLHRPKYIYVSSATIRMLTAPTEATVVEWSLCLLFICDVHVIAGELHTLVDMNGKRIITSEHEFVFQHILMRYQICRIKSVNYVLLLLTVTTHF